MLLLMVAIVYYPALDGYFIEDDWRILGYAKDIANNFSFSKLAEYLVSTPENHPLAYKPVPYFLCALDYMLWKDDPAGYHATNLVLYWLATCCVFLVGYMLGFGKIPSLVASLLFLIHPLHSGSVIWIACREEIAADVFYLVSLLLGIVFLQSGSRVFLLFSLFFGVLTALSKYVVLTLPLSMILADLILREKLSIQRMIRRFPVHLPYFILIGFYLLLRFYLYGGLGRPPQASEYNFSTFEGLLGIAKNIFVILPSALIFSYPDPGGLDIFRILLFILLLSGGFILVLSPERKSAMGGSSLTRNSGKLLILAVWTLIMVIPVLNSLRSVENQHLTRFYFLATIPFCLFVPLALGYLGTMLPSRFAAIVWFTVAGTIFGGHFLTGTKHSSAFWYDLSDRSESVVTSIREWYPDFPPSGATVYLHGDAQKATWDIAFHFSFTDEPVPFEIRHLTTSLSSLPTGDGRDEPFLLDQLQLGKRDFIFGWDGERGPRDLGIPVQNKLDEIAAVSFEIDSVLLWERGMDQDRHDNSIKELSGVELKRNYPIVHTDGRIETAVLKLPVPAGITSIERFRLCRLSIEKAVISNLPDSIPGVKMEKPGLESEIEPDRGAVILLSWQTDTTPCFSLSRSISIPFPNHEPPAAFSLSPDSPGTGIPIREDPVCRFKIDVPVGNSIDWLLGGRPEMLRIEMPGSWQLNGISFIY